MRRTVRLGCGAAALLVALADGALAQAPLGYVTARGSTVTPAFEGWYPNGDGTLTLSWGFYNRNSEETLEIPQGVDNFVTPTELDGGQPTVFAPRRTWGAFGIVIPDDYDREPVTWTLRIRGGTYSIPANLAAEWQIPGRAGDVGGNTAPELAFTESGPYFSGPGGATSERTATASEPIELTLWGKDDGGGAFPGDEGRGPVSVTLTWLRHAGPGSLTFTEESGPVPASGGSMTVGATFAEVGEYVIRVRANDGSGVAEAGHAQCCWSNAFFRVTVGGP